MSNNVTRISINRIQAHAFSKALLYQGILSRVARRLNLSRAHVYYVAKGMRQSKRVEAALQSEMERIDRKCAA